MTDSLYTVASNGSTTKKVKGLERYRPVKGHMRIW
jgi:hypothetical protein